jgi:hypothetical protein
MIKYQLCSICEHKLILGKAWITEIEPDAEPYQAGVKKDMENIDCNVCLNLHYCPNCQIVHDLWDDDREHLIGNA